MNLQAKMKSGSKFSDEDILEVVFNSDNIPVATVVHTIKVVSGPAVTHGGGGLAGDYLHYKSVERDADADGIIDYSEVEMRVVQESQGTSVIKVVCATISQADADDFNTAMSEFSARVEAAGVTEETPNGTDGTFTEEAPTAPDSTILETGEITLEWSDDTFV
jgi:hypothetical protein